MNIREGLERISVVWWSFWGLCSFGFSIAVLFNKGALSDALAGLGGVLVCIVAHRVFCWILRGFFPARTG